jgi:hypothetical protein
MDEQPVSSRKPKPKTALAKSLSPAGLKQVQKRLEDAQRDRENRRPVLEQLLP